MKIKISNRHRIILTTLWLATCSIDFTLAEDTPPPAATEAQTAEPPAAITTVPRTEPSPQASLLADLSNELKNAETEILNLEAGDDKFVAYYHNRSGALSHGGIIFFPNDYTHPNWPIFIEPLRTGLSDFGWSTLAVSLPEPVILAKPIRTRPSLKAIRVKPPTEAQDTAALPADKSTTLAPPAPSENPVLQSSESYTRIIQRGITAVQVLQQKEIDQFVLVGIGTGATWATALALDLQAQSNVNLLIINAEQSLDISAPQLLELIPKLKLTTIDLYSSNPNSSSNTSGITADLRIKTARRNSLNNYHQSRLPMTTNTIQGQDWLVRYTRGLLETYIVKAEKETTLIPPSAPSAPSINQAPGMPPLNSTKKTDPI